VYSKLGPPEQTTIVVFWVRGQKMKVISRGRLLWIVYLYSPEIIDWSPLSYTLHHLWKQAAWSYSTCTCLKWLIGDHYPICYIICRSRPLGVTVPALIWNDCLRTIAHYVTSFAEAGRLELIVPALVWNDCLGTITLHVLKGSFSQVFNSWYYLYFGH